MRIPVLALAVILTNAIPSLAQRPAVRVSELHREEWNIEQLRHELHRLDLERRRIAVRWQKNNRGEYEFFCDNRTFSDYTVEVNFSEFVNLQADLPTPINVEVTPGSHMIFILRKATGGSPVRFQYHVHTYKGRPSPKIDTGFTYLLPIAPGKEARIYELPYIGEKYAGEMPPKDWYVLSLRVKAGDTVYAARRGRVTNVSDNANLQDSNYSYVSSDNYVEIEHSDYTFGKYTIFRDKAIFVQPGEFVEAGQPLGIAGGDKYAGGPQIRFSVFYQQRQEILDKDSVGTGRMENWAYVPLCFWTKDGGRTRLTNKATYTGDSPADLITREMPKKEAKKWKEAHKAS